MSKHQNNKRKDEGGGQGPELIGYTFKSRTVITPAGIEVSATMCPERLLKEGWYGEKARSAS